MTLTVLSMRRRIYFSALKSTYNQYIQMKTEKALFKVVGMYCTTCKPIVEKQLKDEEAVKKIDIDYMTDSVVVEYDTSLITKEEIKSRLEKSGYKFVRTIITR
jgi:copper chaperone